MLFGQYGQNLALIERRLGVVANSRGNHVTLEGPREACEQARRVLESLYERLKRGDELAQGDVDGTIRLAMSQGSLFDFDPAAGAGEFRGDQSAQTPRARPHRRRRTPISARSSAMRWCSATGPAGTGKTWLAVAHAVQLFERKEVDRIVLSRPAVEAGERLGFLPGDMREKVDPYLRPIYDALYDLMDARIVERALQTTEIEIAPLAFMRGRTLSNAAIILDEAQNTTAMQMKMLLTRLGENSRMVVTGDPSQVDLPPGQTSGLADAVRLLEGVEGIGHVSFLGRRRHPPRTRRAHRRGLRQGGSGERKRERPRMTRAARQRAAQSMCSSQSGLWKDAGKCQTGGAARRRARPPPRCQQRGAELAIVLTDDSAIRLLNRRLARRRRGHECPVVPDEECRRRAAALGDIVLAYETIAREARAERKPFAHHLAHLAVHGFLHLVGYDHERDKDAEAMERLERKILRRLAIPDPYRPVARRRPRKRAESLRKSPQKSA